MIEKLCLKEIHYVTMLIKAIKYSHYFGIIQFKKCKGIKVNEFDKQIVHVKKSKASWC